MDLAYVAHSERCALLLDAEGVCRWVIPKVDAKDAMVAAAKRCIGAQFIATLDRDMPGYMGHEPRVSANLLFALVTDGRVALVRFGPLVAFEELDAASEPAEHAEHAEHHADDVVEKPAAEARVDETPTVSAPAIEAADAEDEPLPPTVAAAIDVDDLIMLLSDDDVSAPEGAADDGTSAVVEDEAPAETRIARAAEATETTEDPTPIAPAAGAAELEEAQAASTGRPSEPAPLDDGDDVAIVTGSFSRISESALQAVESSPSGLDALDALVSKRRSTTEGEDSRDRSLEPIVELPSAREPDDAQLDIITVAFTRSEQLAVLLTSEDATLDTSEDATLDASEDATLDTASDDVVLDTGSFALASDKSSSDLDGGDPFMADTEREPVRPSGFVVKRATQAGEAGPATQATPERPSASDDETRRFSRAAGDVPFVELVLDEEPPRRGMLPRR